MTDWNKLLNNQSKKIDTYDIKKLYDKNEEVIFEGKYYKALANTLGTIPIASNVWTPINTTKPFVQKKIKKEIEIKKEDSPKEKIIVVEKIIEKIIKEPVRPPLDTFWIN